MVTHADACLCPQVSTELQASQQRAAELSAEHSKLDSVLKAETARADRASQEVTAAAIMLQTCYMSFPFCMCCISNSSDCSRWLLCQITQQHLLMRDQHARALHTTLLTTYCFKVVEAFFFWRAGSSADKSADKTAHDSDMQYCRWGLNHVAVNGHV